MYDATLCRCAHIRGTGIMFALWPMPGAGEQIRARSLAPARLYSNDTVMIVAIGDRRANTIWDLHIAPAPRVIAPAPAYGHAYARVLACARVLRINRALCGALWCRSAHLARPHGYL